MSKRKFQLEKSVNAEVRIRAFIKEVTENARNVKARSQNDKAAKKKGT